METVDYGTVITLPENPTKESTQKYSYTFAGWDKPVDVNCEGNAVYVANFIEEKIEYLIN